MNYANRSATRCGRFVAPLLPLVRVPLVTLTISGAAHIELELTGGRKHLIVLDNETRQAVAYALQGSEK